MMSPSPEIAPQSAIFADQLKTAAGSIGFDLVGIAPAISASGFADLERWIDAGFAGKMEYIPRRRPAYQHPSHVLKSVASVVMLGVNYKTEAVTSPHPGDLPDATLEVAPRPRIARYAWSATDYHETLRGMLQQLADWLHDHCPGCRTRGVVDTAPLLERDFAKLAGLGWFGKNTMLINKQLGSYFFLAALLTDVPLQADASHATAHCGTCTRCLEICPTGAFVEPYVLDARKCLAYLTIELRGTIPQEFRDQLGEWVFGCDLCQEVCPWNRKSPLTTLPAFQPEDSLRDFNALAVLSLTESEFIERFGKTPLARSGRVGMIRNAALALGNLKDERALPELRRLSTDENDVIREAATWAIDRIQREHPTDQLRDNLLLDDNSRSSSS